MRTLKNKYMKVLSMCVLVTFFTNFIFGDYAYASKSSVASVGLPSISKLRKAYGYDRPLAYVTTREQAAIDSAAENYISRITNTYNSQVARIKENLSNKINQVEGNKNFQINNIKSNSENKRAAVVDNYQRNKERYEAAYESQSGRVSPSDAIDSLDNAIAMKKRKLDIARGTISDEQLSGKVSKFYNTIAPFNYLLGGEGQKLKDMNDSLKDGSSQDSDIDATIAEIKDLEDRKAALEAMRSGEFEEQYQSNLADMEAARNAQLNEINDKTDSYISSIDNNVESSIDNMSESVDKSIAEIRELAQGEIESYLFDEENGLYAKAYKYDQESILRDLQVNEEQTRVQQIEGSGGYLGNIEEWMPLEDQNQAKLANQYLDRSLAMLSSGVDSVIDTSADLTAAASAAGKDVTILEGNTNEQGFLNSAMQQPIELEDGLEVGEIDNPDFAPVSDVNKTAQEIENAGQKTVLNTNNAADQINDQVTTNAKAANEDISDSTTEYMQEADNVNMKAISALLNFMNNIEQYMDMLAPSELAESAEVELAAFEAYDTYRKNLWWSVVGGIVASVMGIGMVVMGMLALCLGSLLLIAGGLMIIGGIVGTIMAFSKYEAVRRAHQDAQQAYADLETELADPYDFEPGQTTSEYEDFLEAQRNYSAALSGFSFAFFKEFGALGLKKVRKKIAKIRKLMGGGLGSLGIEKLRKLQAMLFDFFGEAFKNKALKRAMENLKVAFKDYETASENLKNSTREITLNKGIKVYNKKTGKWEVWEQESVHTFGEVYAQFEFIGQVAGLLGKALEENWAWEKEGNLLKRVKMGALSAFAKGIRTAQQKFGEAMDKWIGSDWGDWKMFNWLKTALTPVKWLVNKFVGNFTKAVINFVVFAGIDLVVHTAQGFQSGGDKWYQQLAHGALEFVKGFVGMFTTIFENMFGIREGTIMHCFETGNWGEARVRDEEGRWIGYTTKAHGLEFWNPGAAIGTVTVFILMAGKAGYKAFFKNLVNLKNLVVNLGKNFGRAVKKGYRAIGTVAGKTGQAIAKATKWRKVAQIGKAVTITLGAVAIAPIYLVGKTVIAATKATAKFAKRYALNLRANVAKAGGGLKGTVKFVGAKVVGLFGLDHVWGKIKEIGQSAKQAVNLVKIGKKGAAAGKVAAIVFMHIPGLMMSSLMSLGLMIAVTNPLLFVGLKTGSYLLHEAVMNQSYAKKYMRRQAFKKAFGDKYKSKGKINVLEGEQSMKEFIDFAEASGVRLMEGVEGSLKAKSGKLAFGEFMRQLVRGKVETVQVDGINIKLNAKAKQALFEQYLRRANSAQIKILHEQATKTRDLARIKGEGNILEANLALEQIARENAYRAERASLKAMDTKLTSNMRQVKEKLEVSRDLVEKMKQLKELKRLQKELREAEGKAGQAAIIERIKREIRKLKEFLEMEGVGLDKLESKIKELYEKIGKTKVLGERTLAELEGLFGADLITKILEGKLSSKGIKRSIEAELNTQTLKTREILLDRANYETLNNLRKIAEFRDTVLENLKKQAKEAKKSGNEALQKELQNKIKRIKNGNIEFLKESAEGKMRELLESETVVINLLKDLTPELFNKTLEMAKERTGIDSINHYYERVATLKNRMEDMKGEKAHDFEIRQEYEHARKVLANLELNRMFAKNVVSQIINGDVSMLEIGKLKKRIDILRNRTKAKNLAEAKFFDRKVAEKMLRQLQDGLERVGKKIMKYIEKQRKAQHNENRSEFQKEADWIIDLVEGRDLAKNVQIDLRKIKAENKILIREAKEAKNTERLEAENVKIDKFLKTPSAASIAEILQMRINRRIIEKDLIQQKLLTATSFKSKIELQNQLNQNLRQIEIYKTIQANITADFASNMTQGLLVGRKGAIPSNVQKYLKLLSNIMSERLKLGEIKLDLYSTQIGGKSIELSNASIAEFSGATFAGMNITKGFFEKAKYDELYGGKKMDQASKRLNKYRQKIIKLTEGKSLNEKFKNEVKKSARILAETINIESNLDMSEAKKEASLKKLDDYIDKIDKQIEKIKKEKNRFGNLKSRLTEIIRKNRKVTSRFKQIARLEKLKEALETIKKEGELKENTIENLKNVIAEYLAVSGKVGAEFLLTLEGVTVKEGSGYNLKLDNLQIEIERYQTVVSEGRIIDIKTSQFRDNNVEIVEEATRLCKELGLKGDVVATELAKVSIREMNAEGLGKLIKKAKEGINAEVNVSNKMAKDVLTIKKYNEFKNPETNAERMAKLKSEVVNSKQYAKATAGARRKLVEENVPEAQVERYFELEAKSRVNVEGKKITHFEARELKNLKAKVFDSITKEQLAETLQAENITVSDLVRGQSAEYIKAVLRKTGPDPVLEKMAAVKGLEYLQQKTLVLRKLEGAIQGAKELYKMRSTKVKARIEALRKEANFPEQQFKEFRKVLDKFSKQGEKLERLKNNKRATEAEKAEAKQKYDELEVEMKSQLEVVKNGHEALKKAADLLISRKVNEIGELINEFRELSKSGNSRLELFKNHIGRIQREATKEYFEFLVAEENIVMGRMYELIRKEAVKQGKNLTSAEISKLEFDGIDGIFKNLTYEQIFKELFKVDLAAEGVKPTQLQADVFSLITLKMVEGHHELSSGGGTQRDISLTNTEAVIFQNQMLGLVVCDAGGILALKMGYGKTRIYPTAFGRQLIMKQSPNNIAEILVSAKQEVSNMRGNKAYMKRFYGIELVDGIALHKQGKLGEYVADAIARKKRACYVIDLETRGHISHEMLKNKSLESLFRVGTKIVDEADALSLKQQSFINAERMDAPYQIKRQAAEILEACRDLKMEEFYSDGLISLRPDRANSLVKKLRQSKVFDGLKKGEVSYLVQQTLRAKAEVELGQTTGGHKTDPVAGINYGVKDGVDINAVASQIYEPFYRDGHRNFTIRNFENSYTRLSEFKAEISRTTVEASTQQVLTSKIKAKIYGGSGTTWGARRISDGVSASVYELVEASFAEYAYKTSLGSKASQPAKAAGFFNNLKGKNGWGGLVIQDHVNIRENLLRSLNETAPAEFLKKVRNATKGYDRVTALERTMKLDKKFIDPVFNKKEGGYKTLEQTMRNGSVKYDNGAFRTRSGKIVNVSVMDILKSPKACEALGLKSADRGNLGFGEIFVFDNYTDTSVVSGIAKTSSSKGYRIFSTAKAGRGMDFRGKMELLVLDTANIPRNDLLQILGRVGRGDYGNIFYREVVVDQVAVKQKLKNQLEIYEQKMKAYKEAASINENGEITSINKGKYKNDATFKKKMQAEVSILHEQIKEAQQYYKEIHNSGKELSMKTQQQLVRVNSRMLGEGKANGASLYQIGEGVRSALIKIPLEALLALARGKDKATLRNMIEDIRNGRGQTANLIRAEKGEFRTAQEALTKSLESNVNAGIQIMERLLGVGGKNRVARLLGQIDVVKNKVLRSEIRARLIDLKAAKKQVNQLKKANWQDIRYEIKQRANKGEIVTMTEINSSDNPFIASQVVDTATYIGRHLNPQLKTKGVGKGVGDIAPIKNVRIGDIAVTGSRSKQVVRFETSDPVMIVESLRKISTKAAKRMNIGAVVLSSQNFREIQDDEEIKRRYEEVISDQVWGARYFGGRALDVYVSDSEDDLKAGNYRLVNGGSEDDKAELQRVEQNYERAAGSYSDIYIGINVSDEDLQKEAQGSFEKMIEDETFGVSEAKWNSAEKLRLRIANDRFNGLEATKQKEFKERLEREARMKKETKGGEIVVDFVSNINEDTLDDEMDRLSKYRLQFSDDNDQLTAITQILVNQNEKARLQDIKDKNDEIDNIGSELEELKQEEARLTQREVEIGAAQIVAERNAVYDEFEQSILGIFDGLEIEGATIETATVNKAFFDVLKNRQNAELIIQHVDRFFNAISGKLGGETKVEDYKIQALKAAEAEYERQIEIINQRIEAAGPGKPLEDLVEAHLIIEDQLANVQANRLKRENEKKERIEKYRIDAKNLKEVKIFDDIEDIEVNRAIIEMNRQEKLDKIAKLEEEKQEINEEAKREREEILEKREGKTAESRFNSLYKEYTDEKNDKAQYRKLDNIRRIYGRASIEAKPPKAQLLFTTDKNVDSLYQEIENTRRRMLLGHAKDRTSRISGISFIGDLAQRIRIKKDYDGIERRQLVLNSGMIRKAKKAAKKTAKKGKGAITKKDYQELLSVQIEYALDQLRLNRLAEGDEEPYRTGEAGIASDYRFDEIIVSADLQNEAEEAVRSAVERVNRKRDRLISQDRYLSPLASFVVKNSKGHFVDAYTEVNGELVSRNKDLGFTGMDMSRFAGMGFDPSMFAGMGGPQTVEPKKHKWRIYQKYEKQIEDILSGLEDKKGQTVIDLNNVSDRHYKKMFREIYTEISEDGTLPQDVVFLRKGVYFGATSGELETKLEKWRPVEGRTESLDFRPDATRAQIARELKPEIEEGYFAEDMLEGMLESGIGGSEISLKLALDDGTQLIYRNGDNLSFTIEGMHYYAENRVDFFKGFSQYKKVFKNGFVVFPKIEEGDKEGYKEGLEAERVISEIVKKEDIKYLKPKLVHEDGKTTELIKIERTPERVNLNLTMEGMRYYGENEIDFLKGLRQIEMEYRDLGKNFDIVLPDLEENDEKGLEAKRTILGIVSVFSGELKIEEAGPKDKTEVRVKNKKGNVLLDYSRKPDERVDRDLVKSSVLKIPNTALASETVFRTWLTRMLVDPDVKKLGGNIVLGLEEEVGFGDVAARDVAWFADVGGQADEVVADIDDDDSLESLAELFEDEIQRGKVVSVFDDTFRDFEKVLRDFKGENITVVSRDGRVIVENTYLSNKVIEDGNKILTVRLTDELRTKLEGMDLADVNTFTITEAFANEPQEVMALVRLLNRGGFKGNIIVEKDADRAIDVYGAGSQPILRMEQFFKEGAVVKDVGTESDFKALMESLTENFEKNTENKWNIFKARRAVKKAKKALEKVKSDAYKNKKNTKIQKLNKKLVKLGSEIKEIERAEALKASDDRSNDIINSEEKWKAARKKVRSLEKKIRKIEKKVAADPRLQRELNIFKHSLVTAEDDLLKLNRPSSEDLQQAKSRVKANNKAQKKLQEKNNEKDKIEKRIEKLNEELDVTKREKSVEEAEKKLTDETAKGTDASQYELVLNLKYRGGSELSWLQKFKLNNLIKSGRVGTLTITHRGEVIATNNYELNKYMEPFIGKDKEIIQLNSPQHVGLKNIKEVMKDTGFTDVISAPMPIDSQMVMPVAAGNIMLGVTGSNRAYQSYIEAITSGEKDKGVDIGQFVRSFGRAVSAVSMNFMIARREEISKFDDKIPSDNNLRHLDTAA